MSKKQKLIEKLKTRSSKFEYDEAESLLLSLGLENRTREKPAGRE